MENQDSDLARLEAIPPLIAQTRKVRTQIRLLRLGFALAAFLVVLGWLWSIASHVQRFDIEKFGAEMAKKAERTWPIIADELTKFVDGVIPTAEAALDRELEKAAPEIEAKFRSEITAVEEGVKQSVNRTLKQYLIADNRADAIRTIQAAFPEFQDAAMVEKLVASLQEAFLADAQRELLTMLAQYYDTLQKFQGAFNKIRADTPPGQRPASMEGVLSLWLELVYEKMGGDSTLEGKAAAPAPAKGK